MKYFFYDASRLAISFVGVTLNAITSSTQKLKACVFSCLSSGLVSRDEFTALSQVAKETAIKQSEMEKKINKMAK